MKQFLIRYRRGKIAPEAWHQDIARFIAAVQGDSELSGITYRCLRIADGDEYIHLATAADDAAIKALQSRDFFKRYNEQTRSAAVDGKVEVLKLDVIGETKRTA